MEITKEQIDFIRTAHRVSCRSWKFYIQDNFPNIIEEKNKVERSGFTISYA